MNAINPLPLLTVEQGHHLAFIMACSDRRRFICFRSRALLLHRRGFGCRLLSAVLPLGLACVLTGCLSRPALVHQTFALHAEPAMKTNSATGQGVLAIPTVQVCPMFERRSFVYRIGPDLYEADPYAEFLVPPSRALAIPMRACLRNCGVFREVLEAGSQREADTLLEVHAHELYGDFRKTGPPTAVLSIRILLFEAENGQPQSLLLQKFYTRRVPLKDKTAVALAAGWNQALAEIMAEATSDISTARGMTAAK